LGQADKRRDVAGRSSSADRSFVPRPGLIVGPNDPTDRAMVLVAVLGMAQLLARVVTFSG
jgi:hypothetical protein